MKPQFGIRSKTFPRGDCRAGVRNWHMIWHEGDKAWVRWSSRKSFERIHRSNLVGMGYCLPVLGGNERPSLGLTGAELIHSQGIGARIVPAKPSPLDKVPVGRGERGSSACSDRYFNRGRLLLSWRYSSYVLTVEPISCLCSTMVGNYMPPQPRAKQEARPGGLQTLEVPSCLQKGS